MSTETSSATAQTDSSEDSQVIFDETDSRKSDMHETIEEWIQDLIELTGDARASEEFQEWLDVQSRFHDYSYRNSLLISLQKPDATRVAGYQTWKNDFNRYVKEGEKAIWIWAPIIAKQCPECENAPRYHEDIDCGYDETAPETWEKGLVGFKPTTVFDISQTEGEALPEIQTETSGSPGNLPQAFLAASDSLGVEASIIPQEEWEYGDTNGVCRGPDPYTLKPIVEVRNRENKADLTRTFAHEFAHAELHFNVDDREKKNKREVEAESTAYIISRYFGLNPDNSGFYLAAWAEDEEETLTERLQRISNTAQSIIKDVEDAANDLVAE